RARAARSRVRALPHGPDQCADADRLGAALRAGDASPAALRRIPPPPRELERIAERPVPCDRGRLRAARAALHGSRLRARRDSAAHSAGARATDVAGALPRAARLAAGGARVAVHRPAPDDPLLPRRGAARVRAAVRSLALPPRAARG